MILTNHLSQLDDVLNRKSMQKHLRAIISFNESCKKKSHARNYELATDEQVLQHGTAVGRDAAVQAASREGGGGLVGDQGWHGRW